MNNFTVKFIANIFSINYRKVNSVCIDKTSRICTTNIRTIITWIIDSKACGISNTLCNYSCAILIYTNKI